MPKCIVRDRTVFGVTENPYNFKRLTSTPKYQGQRQLRLNFDTLPSIVDCKRPQEMTLLSEFRRCGVIAKRQTPNLLHAKWKVNHGLVKNRQRDFLS